jgi:hypothetical protein
MRSMDAEAVLKHRVCDEQTSGEKKSPSKGVIIYYFFPAQMQIFRPIGQTFGARRERVKYSVHIRSYLLRTEYSGAPYPSLAFLKGPKHEIFESGFVTQIRPVWLGDLGTVYTVEKSKKK